MSEHIKVINEDFLEDALEEFICHNSASDFDDIPNLTLDVKYTKDGFPICNLHENGCPGPCGATMITETTSDCCDWMGHYKDCPIYKKGNINEK